MIQKIRSRLTTAGDVATNATMIQHISIEGAYDEAIEDAASRIFEASRPHRLITRRSSSSSLSDVALVNEKNEIVSSSPSDSNDDSSEGSEVGDDNSIRTSTSGNYMDDDDIESNILFLEEKKLILKKAKTHREKEKAYIALNAHDIANGREPSSRRTRSSLIWSEAKAMIEEFRLAEVGGSRSEEEEGNSPDSVSSSVIDSETRRSGSSHSTPHTRLSPLASSSSYQGSHAKINSLSRKRLKIDISMVKHICSTEYAKECREKEAAKSENGGDRSCISGRNQYCISPTASWQQVNEIQLAINSRKWISQAVLKQILVLSNTAISEHRRSIMTTGKGE